ncbi:MAG: right-handed parallel beta-helix repeat-containing protein [Phycisphaerales bacterium]
MLASLLLIALGKPGTNAALADRPNGPALPIVRVTADNTVLDRPCRVVIPPGAVIRDADADGVIHVRFDDGVVEFEPGSVLRGSPPGDDPDTFAGTGVRLEGRRGVTIRGAAIEGFKIGLHATRTDGLVLDGCRFDDQWRQRLRSTPQAEDQGDWLWPHDNDGGEWRTRYGASACIERSERVTVRACQARRGQNGLILDRVNHAAIYDNDFSFLSGWGLALWRSGDNLIARNALDFCIRGYSHGVYNRGQDSAGILCFEQCSRNRFIENSATHGGDGFFGFAGKEALGDTPAPIPDFDHARRGCNDNHFLGNDFSFAAAHGLELTFSFGNSLSGNRFIENAICGIWGGYSRDTIIDRQNVFTRNGEAGYGLERGGVNVEHGSNNVISGRFEGNACGVHLWWDEDAAIAKLPWARVNGVESRGNTVYRATFARDKIGVHLRASSETVIIGCVFDACGEEVRHDATSVPRFEVSPAEPAQPLRGMSLIDERNRDSASAPGRARPVGSRAHLAGRHNIIMTEWGPWDHQSPLIRFARDDGPLHQYDLFHLPDGDLAIAVEQGGPGVEARSRSVPDGDPRSRIVIAAAITPGVHPYTLRATAGSFDQRMSGVLVNCSWDVRFFPSPADPRDDLAAWRAGARSDKAVNLELSRLKLPFGLSGPSELQSSEIMQDLRDARIPHNHFGTMARTVIPLPAGAWRIKTLSDDGVRVTIRMGGLNAGRGPLQEARTIIENWTHHGPTRDEGTFVVEGEPGSISPVEIEVEHFELDGYAVLDVAIEPVR